MTIFKNISNGCLYTIYKNSDGTLIAFPAGKVTDFSKIIKDCDLNDFVMERIEKENIKGFL
jgi:hypothetical protein